MKWKCEIQPLNPAGRFPKDDWRRVGKTFECGTATGAKRIASKWAGLSSGKWENATESYYEYVKEFRGGILILREVDTAEGNF